MTVKLYYVRMAAAFILNIRNVFNNVIDILINEYADAFEVSGAIVRR